MPLPVVYVACHTEHHIRYGYAFISMSRRHDDAERRYAHFAKIRRRLAWLHAAPAAAALCASAAAGLALLYIAIDVCRR